MILIVTLNLFIHKTAIIDGLEVGTINHIQDQRLVVGDSAIYSALIIKTLQGEPYVLGVSGGIGGRFIKNFMDKNRIKSDLLWKEAEIKSELKIIDSIKMSETTLVDDTFSYDEFDIKNLRHKFLNNVQDINTLIVNDQGTVDGISHKMIEEIMMLAHENQMKIIVSLSSSQLRKSMELYPYAVVLLQSDLEEFGVNVGDDENNLIVELRKIARNYKLKYLIYDDKQRLYSVAKNKVCVAKYRKFSKDFEDIAVKDVIVGALALSISRNHAIEKITKLIAATRSAIILSNYPKICMRKDIDDLYNKIKLIEINFVDEIEKE